MQPGEFGYRVWKLYVEDWVRERKVIDIAAILKLLDKILDLEGKFEEAIATEKDKSKRKKIAEAFKKRDRDALAKLLWDD